MAVQAALWWPIFNTERNVSGQARQIGFVPRFFYDVHEFKAILTPVFSEIRRRAEPKHRFPPPSWTSPAALPRLRASYLNGASHAP